MNTEQQHAILTIALHAAFADGSKDDREREHIRQLAESPFHHTAVGWSRHEYADVA